MSGILTTEDYDKSMFLRWAHFFPSCTYWINAETDVLKHVRNTIIATKKGVDQTNVPIYPFIAVSRVGIPEWIFDSMSDVNRGVEATFNLKEYRLMNMQVKLRYHLDIYATARSDFDELVVEVQENFKRNPYVRVCCSDFALKDSSYTMDFEEMTDNTDLETRNDSTPIYRATMVYTINAQIFRREKNLGVRDVHFDFVRHHSIQEVVERFFSLQEEEENENVQDKGQETEHPSDGG